MSRRSSTPHCKLGKYQTKGYTKDAKGEITLYVWSEFTPTPAVISGLNKVSQRQEGVIGCKSVENAQGARFAVIIEAGVPEEILPDALTSLMNAYSQHLEVLEAGLIQPLEPAMALHSEVRYEPH